MPRVYMDTGQKTERVKYDSISISGKFIQVYDDLYPELIKIHSPCAIHLLFWMANHMGDYNQIILNKNSRGIFRGETKGKYKDETIKSALKLLVKNKLVVSMSELGSRGSNYFVNPFYFWKTGSQKDRTESVKGFLYKVKENI